MRRASLCLLTGLSLTFAINCGSGTGDGSGSGGSGGQPSGGTTGKGGGGAGTNGAGGAAGSHATGGAGGGTGGDHATGGAGGDHSTGGAGGASSTGGAGGDHATGGAGGSATGSGGHAGAGGAGTGGGAGAGGHPSGGQGGQAVDSGVTCAELVSEYGAALPEAEACTPGAANQCQQLVATSLGACSCPHYVQDATTLNAIHAQWTNQGCVAAVIICTDCLHQSRNRWQLLRHRRSGTRWCLLPAF